MEALFKKSEDLCTQMEKFEINVDKQKVPKRTRNYYLGRISGYNELWVEFKTNHNKIIEQKKAIDDTHAYFVNEIFDTAEQQYYEFKGRLQDLLEEYSKAGANSTNINHDESDKQNQTLIKLPPAELPKFSGDYSKWISFNDCFSSIISGAGNVPEVQKLNFLISRLEGEALKLVEHYPIEADNFVVVWDMLKKRYENKKLLVNAQLNILFGQQTITKESSHSIKKILDTTTQCIENLKHLDIDTTHWDPILIYLIVQRLPTDTFVLWEQQQDSTTRLPKFSSLATFLENRFQVLESISQSKILLKEKNNFKDVDINEKMQTYAQNGISCPLCSKQHFLGKCFQFKKLPIKERENIVRKNSLCFNCFAKSHVIKNCTSSTRCFECKKKHHTMLHISRDATNNHLNTSTNLSPTAPEFELSANIAINFSQVLLATAKMNLCGPDGRTWSVRALIDPGSQGSFITENLVKKAGLTRLPTRAVVTGFGKIETGRSQSIVNTTLQSKTSPAISIEAEAIVLKNLTNLLPSYPISGESLDKLTTLKLADPTYNTPGAIDILIGADLYPKILLKGVKKLGQGCPIAQNTVFGWILSGPVNNNSLTQNKIQNFFNHMELDQFLKRFWEMEEISKPVPKSKEEEWCERFYKETHTRDKNGKYVVTIPFFNSKDGPAVGSSRRMALKRLENVELRLRKNEKLKEDYENCIQDYIQLGHMKKINKEEAERGSHYFIPHHAVIKEASTSTKLRVVFDASCKTSNGKSLNDQMHIGPRLQPDITAILIRWRCFKFVFCTDVEKMYRQIWVHPEDTKYQRILWKNDKGLVENYELQTVTFELASAPWLAIRTLHQLQEDEGLNYPHAAQVIKENTYVDDVMTGGWSIKETMTMQKELQSMFECGGFKLKKWASNREEILNEIPKEDHIIEFTPKTEGQEIIKTLGISWSPESDEFMFKVNKIPYTEKATKRQILSWLAKIYDPLGWVAPVLIVAKILIQRLWQEGLEWDEKISASNNKNWINFARNLATLESIRIPRWLGVTALEESIELHGFADASQEAYGAVIYSKITNSDGKVKIQLIMAKTRVAPLKTVRLPRLELCAALLLGKLLATVQEALKIKVKRLCAWTDSQITLHWIKDSPSKWPTFVANRVADLHDLTGPGPWRYVPTKENPADCCSRGLTPTDLVDFPLWWNGPKWLKQEEESWPSQKLPTIKAEDLEYKKIKTFANVINKTDNDTLFQKFSDITNLVRISCWCVRFMHNCKAAKAKEKGISGNITALEYRETLARLIRVTQECFFNEEVSSLIRQKSEVHPVTNNNAQDQILRESPIFSLMPFLDDQQILRVRGRIGKSRFPYSERFPIILPFRSPLTKLLVRNAHKTTLHGGIAEMLAYLRRRFWIVEARIVVKNEINQCVVCVRLKQETRSQLMGDLPRCRADIQPPFTNVGVDYAGPILTRPSKLRGKVTIILKGYIAVFVCMSTKAIHIEFVSDLTTEAFLAAFRRFISRRGMCTNLYSDGGSNFQGASNVFEKEIQQMLHKTSEITSATTSLGIQWHFIPPGAPHFGGIWEAGVKSIKHHMRRILGNQVLTFEEMTTMLVQIESCLNSRPLHPMSNDPEDLEVLTPGHFLIGRPLLAPPQEDLTETKINLLNRWNIIQKFQQDFWNSWRSEYLSRLQQRPKWLKIEKNLEIGDLVVVKDDRLPPLHWKLGRIIKVHPGTDSLVRVVTLRTQQGEIKRPITKICLLPIKSQTEA